MIKIGICEDDIDCRESIKRLLELSLVQVGIQYEVKEYGSGTEFLIRNQETDILILDIEMDGLTGIELKDKLAREGEDIKILFVTNHAEIMSEAFGRNVYGFLQKPLEQAKFEKYLRRMTEDMEENESLVIKSVNQELLIKIKSIFYFVSEDKYSRVVSTGGEFFCDRSLGQWEKELKELAFFRCHKCYLVNLRNIQKIESMIRMNNGDKVPVSRRREREFKNSFQEYIIRKAR